MTDMSVKPDAAKRRSKNIFVGSNGLRAGWCALIFVAVVAGLIAALNVGLHAVHFHGPKSDPNIMDPIGTLFQEGLISVILIIATVVTAVITRRKPGQLGFSLNNAVPRFLQGIVFGVACLAGLTGLLYAAGAITFGAIVLHGAEAWRSAGLWAAAFILVGVAEELAFRGYLLQALGRGLNFRWACLIMSVLFAAAHGMNPGETPVTFALGFAAGVVLALSVWRTGTIWWAIGFHAAWDWAQSFLFGVADSGYPASGALMTTRPAGPDWLSGGIAGPEGSVLALVVMAVAAGIVMAMLRKDQDLGVKW